MSDKVIIIVHCSSLPPVNGGSYSVELTCIACFTVVLKSLEGREGG